MSQQLIEDLIATKKTLQRCGRCHYGAYGPQGQMCIAVAVAHATMRCFERSDLVFGVLRAHVLEEFDGNLVAFNENPATTDDDVYNLIDKCLADLGAL